MSVNVEIDKRAIRTFEEFMTDALQAETERAYARTLRLLGAGAVRDVKKRLALSGEYQDMLDAGIDYDAKTAARILKKRPIRIAVGVNDPHQTKRYRKQKFLQSPVGKEFTVHKLDNPFTGVIYETAVLQRFGEPRVAKWNPRNKEGKIYKRQRLHLVIIGERRIHNNAVFGRLVDNYVRENHDAIFEKQFEAAVEREIKKRNR